jgi:indole-3-acetate monooxygenase
MTGARNWMELARSLVPLVEKEAEARGNNNELTEPVVNALADSGLIWAFVPAELGGGGIDLLTKLELIEEIARADGATGWVYFVHMSTTAIASAMLGDAAVAAMYAGGSKPIVSGVLAPTGTAVPRDEGFEVSGRYSFGSGVSFATWVASGALVTIDGVIQRRPNGDPDHRAFHVPADRVRVLGNWDVLGLQGTGSFDFELPRQQIEPDFAYNLPNPSPVRGGPVFRVGLSGLVAGGHTAVALGAAKRALHEIGVHAVSRRGQSTGVLADQQLFKYEYAVKEASLRSARAYVWEVFGAAQARVEEGLELTPEMSHRLRQACTYTHIVAQDVIQFAFNWGGTAGLRRPSVLGQAMLDISGAVQHKYVDTSTLVDAGATLLSALVSDDSDDSRAR